MGKELNSTGVGERIREAVARRGTQEEVAALVGITSRTMGRYINGRTGISSENLRKIAEACGVSPDWLLTGKGDPEQPILNGQSDKNVPLDDELFGRVVDAIHRLYRDERVGLAPIDLGRLAARKYGEIVSATADPDERGAMIKLIVTQLRAEIRAAQTAPGTGKASA